LRWLRPSVADRRWTEVEARYAHLRPDLFPASDLGTIRVDLFAGGAEVVQPRLETGSSRRKAPCKGVKEKKMVGAAL
jgi:hypothetical protein